MSSLVGVSLTNSLSEDGTVPGFSVARPGGDKGLLKQLADWLFWYDYTGSSFGIGRDIDADTERWSSVMIQKQSVS